MRTYRAPFHPSLKSYPGATISRILQLQSLPILLTSNYFIFRKLLPSSIFSRWKIKLAHNSVRWTLKSAHMVTIKIHIWGCCECKRSPERAESFDFQSLVSHNAYASHQVRVLSPGSNNLSWQNFLCIFHPEIVFIREGLYSSNSVQLTIPGQLILTSTTSPQASNGHAQGVK